MRIRSWSLTTFWVVATLIWSTAAALAPVAERHEWLQIGVIALAFSPAFLAGSWGASHPEMARWPRLRIYAMWGFAAAVVLTVGDAIGSWRIPAAVIAAPLAIFTLRWLETRDSHPELPIGSETPTGIPTPPSTPLAG